MSGIFYALLYVQYIRTIYTLWKIFGNFYRKFDNSEILGPDTTNNFPTIQETTNNLPIITNSLKMLFPRRDHVGDKNAPLVRIYFLRIRIYVYVQRVRPRTFYLYSPIYYIYTYTYLHLRSTYRLRFYVLRYTCALAQGAPRRDNTRFALCHRSNFLTHLYYIYTYTYYVYVFTSTFARPHRITITKKPHRKNSEGVLGCGNHYILYLIPYLLLLCRLFYLVTIIFERIFSMKFWKILRRPSYCFSLGRPYFPL